MKHPTALVVYNRPQHTAKVLNKLWQHKVEPLFVFADGPKDKSEVARRRVEQVRYLIEGISWTKPTVFYRERNLGLRRSILHAVDTVLGVHNTVILLEDDCVPGPHFYAYMDACLAQYKDNPNVLGACGYTVPIPKKIRDQYDWDVWFYPRTGSWGWGTWCHKWEWYATPDVYRRVRHAGVDLARGGPAVKGYIERWAAGELDAWTPGWDLAMCVRGGYYVYPTVSHIECIGHDGTGVHCGATERYRTSMCSVPPTRFPGDVVLDERLAKCYEKVYGR